MFRDPAGPGPKTCRTARNIPITPRAARWLIQCLTGDTAVDVPDGDVAELAAHLAVRILPAGADAFASGDRPDGVSVIRSGAIELMIGEGPHRRVAQVLRQGDVFGDIPLLLDRDPPYRPRAATTTTCLWIAAEDFRRLVSDRPVLARVWLISCARRFFDSQARLLRLVDGALPQRVARHLLSEARDGVVALPQATLAAMLGIPRPSLNRVLRDFERRRLISLHYRQVRLLDIDGLRRAAHD
ncbi:CRP-like cAMP-binding protein [Amycolatopsis echigonensis]|uniref:CRP-like cAMP-binding protein n=2 Tax=Pseudonocardiaceae TaxID=2070 RepID=A0A2N3WJL0_9PSEU|nr:MULTISPECIES: Crp/Fnr family transcriptional regulator [Pseudonocardiaceae]AEA23528.1 transcriptional regulator, Crp/Fnr family [Pseudonocardia dioxanivorans CB1190]PKV94042.1 CRP-like cAMP-binding protein [Amycolatopsis niigatensis]